MICPHDSRCESLNAKHYLCMFLELSDDSYSSEGPDEDWLGSVSFIPLCLQCRKTTELVVWGNSPCNPILNFPPGILVNRVEWCCNVFLYCIHSSKGKKRHVPLERGWLQFLCLDYTHTYQCGCTCAHSVRVTLSLWPGLCSHVVCLCILCLLLYCLFFSSFVQLTVKSLL